MKLRTNYGTWIKNRWFNIFLLGHLKDIKISLIKIFISIIALIIALPYLLLEGIVRLILKLLREND